MSEYIRRAKEVIDDIKRMEEFKVRKEHIEYVTRKARAELRVALKLYWMHPTVSELNELFEKYLVE